MLHSAVIKMVSRIINKAAALALVLKFAEIFNYSAITVVAWILWCTCALWPYVNVDLLCE